MTLQRTEEISCAVYNAECAYADARKLLERFDSDYPGLALVQMVEAQKKVLESVEFLALACKLIGEKAKGATNEQNALQAVNES